MRFDDMMDAAAKAASIAGDLMNRLNQLTEEQARRGEKVLDVQKQHRYAATEIISMEQQHATMLQSLDLGEVFAPMVKAAKDALQHFSKVVEMVKNVYAAVQRFRNARGSLFDRIKAAFKVDKAECACDEGNSGEGSKGGGDGSGSGGGGAIDFFLKLLRVGGMVRRLKEPLLKFFEMLQNANPGGKLAGAFSRMAGSGSGLVRVLGTILRGVTGVGGSVMRLAGTFGIAATRIVSVLAPVVGAIGIGVTMALKQAAAFIEGFFKGVSKAAQPIVTAFKKTMFFGRAFEASQPFMEAGQGLQNSRETFASMMGSPQAGKDMVNWIQDFRMSSKVSQSGLESAALTMMQGGLDPVKFLKLAEGLAYKSGKPMEAAIQEAAALMSDLQNGNTDRLRDLSQYKIDSSKFKGKKGSEIISSLDSQIERDPEVAAMREMVQNSGINQVEQGMAGIYTVIQDIGIALGEVFGPTLHDAATYLMEISESGVFDSIIQGFADLFGIGKGENPLIETINYVIGFLKDLPAHIKKVMDFVEKVSNFINDIVDKFNKVKGVVEWMNPLNWPDKIAELAGKIGEETGFTWFNGVVGWITDKTRNIWNHGVRETKERNKRLENQDPPANRLPQLPEPEKPEEGDGGNDVKDGKDGEKDKRESIDSDKIRIALLNQQHQTNIYLSKIQQHTYQLVGANRIMAGGGALGQAGITAIEASKLNYGEPPRQRFRTKVFSALVEDFIVDLAQELIRQNQRAGGRQYS